MLSSHDTSLWHRLAIVGNGRIGRALARALTPASDAPIVPFGRGFDGTSPGADSSQQAYDAVLLCVPDSEIAVAAALIPPGILVGHCSGATGLEVLAGHEGFSLHPLMTVTADGADFRGVGAAIDGTSERALAYADALALELGMTPFRVAPEDRVAYHAAASIASNFLVTLEAAAERLAATAGIDRRLMVPLVRATVANWAQLGAAQALTGPVVRGDVATVQRQREVVSDRTPELLGLFDAMVSTTGQLADQRQPQ